MEVQCTKKPLVNIPMCMNYRMSKHAMLRIESRTHLNAYDVVELIQSDKTIDIGVEGLNRHHLLFYSVFDEQCFVAVVDMTDKVVITVLPIDYHNTCTRHVSPETQSKARVIACAVSTQHPTQKKRGLKTKATFKDCNNVETTIGLGKLRVSVRLQMGELSTNETVLTQVHNRVMREMQRNKMNVGEDTMISVEMKGYNSPLWYTVFTGNLVQLRSRT